MKETIVKNILFSLLAIFLFFIGLEAAYRVKVYVTTKNADVLLYGVDVFKIKAGRAYSKIETAFKKNNDQKSEIANKIWCFGGSNVVCIEVTPQDSWPMVMESSLNEKLGKESVKVTNYGVSGSICKHNLNKLKGLLETSKETPNMVIFYQGINDTIAVNLLIKQNKYVFSPSFIEKANKVLMKTSVLYVALREKYYKIFHKDMSKVYTGSKVLLNEFSDDISELIKLCRACKITLILCSEPVSGGFLDKEGLARAYAEVYETMKRVANANNIPYIDVNKDIYTEDANFGKYFTDGVHVNKAGNRAVALFLVKRLSSIYNFK